VRRLTLLTVMSVALSGPGVAQLPDLPSFGADWTAVGLPRLYWTPANGITAGLLYAQVMQLGYDEWDAPPPYRMQLSLDGDIAASGSKRLRLEARMPQWIDGWRFIVALEGRRDARERYAGIGNKSVIDDVNVTSDNPHYYRSDNHRLYGRLAVQRRIIGGLRVLAGLHAERWKIDTLSGASQLANDVAGGVDPAIGRGVGDVSARVGLVFDTRNDEPAPTSGVFLEAIVGFADSSVVGDVSYTRTNVSATAYIPLRHNLGVAVRLAGQTMSGTPPLGAFYRFESSERPFLALGGTSSHRALPNRRLLDADKLFANLDIRYDLIVEPTLFRVTAVGFLDAGRVFPAGDFKLTTNGLKVGGGAGLFVKLFRSAVVGSTTGIGPDGVILLFHTWWPF